MDSYSEIVEVTLADVGALCLEDCGRGAEQIAQSVGLTERTFFRHFSDKREVLFYGQEQFLQVTSEGPMAKRAVRRATRFARIDLLRPRSWPANS